MKKEQNKTIFNTNSKEKTFKMKKTSGNKIGLHLRVIGTIERWGLKTFKHIDPETDRIVRFYTYKSIKGQRYEFKCPNYTYDLTSGLYDDFVRASEKIGENLQKNFGLIGKYFYDVKITLHKNSKGIPDLSWRIIRTDNPRCVLGNPEYRKDCSYLRNTKSQITIEGYTLSGNYTNIGRVIKDLSNKYIIVHSESDVKALFRLMKFFNVSFILVGNNSYYNCPNHKIYFNKIRFAWHLDELNMSICSVAPWDISVNTEDILDIDELIVKKSLKARFRDRKRVNNIGKRKRSAHKRASINS